MMTLYKTHSIVCDAPREAVYGIIAGSERWPEIFEPCIAVDVVARDTDFEEIEITALVNGQPMRWRSRRRLSPEVFGIDSELVKPMPLVKTMQTCWRVAEVNAVQSVLILDHAYEICDDVSGLVPGVDTRAEATDYIGRAIDSNSTTELRNIKGAAERAHKPVVERYSHHTTHSVLCHASARAVYAVIADVGKWPQLFDSCQSAVVVESKDAVERIKIEARQNGKIISWMTERHYMPQALRIDFTLPEPMPFLTAMAGQWRVVCLGAERALLTVARSFDIRPPAAGQDQPTPAQILEFFDENAATEMQAIKSCVEHGDAAFTALKTRHFLPFSPDRIYALLADVTHWPDTLPHCSGIEVLYDDGCHQEFVMSIAGNGGAERFRSIRTCDDRTLSITYFQPEPPAVLTRHQGSWRVRPVPGGAEVIAEHAIRLDLARCAQSFGTEDVAVLKRQVKERIAAAGKTTIDACAVRLSAEGQ